MKLNFKMLLRPFLILKRVIHFKNTDDNRYNRVRQLWNYFYYNAKKKYKTIKYGFNWKYVSISIIGFLLISWIFYNIYASIIPPFEYTRKYDQYIIQFKEEEKEQIIKKSIEDLNCKLYKIKNKDNFWQIAKENDLDIDTILGCNPYYESIYAYVNQEVLIPDKKGVIHYVRKNENLRSISKLYGVAISEIKKNNHLHWWKFKKVKEGDILFIPGAKPVMMTEKMAEYFSKRDMFCSPIPGVYTSGFGWRHHPIYRVRKFHKGLDIRAKIGTAVCSAADGVVIFSGWMKGYGKIVRIKHNNGYMTGYGHLSRYYVKTGEQVRSGQIIGKSGNSGESTGPHLDFTLFKDNKPINPALYLW